MPGRYRRIPSTLRELKKLQAGCSADVDELERLVSQLEENAQPDENLVTILHFWKLVSLELAMHIKSLEREMPA